VKNCTVPGPGRFGLTTGAAAAAGRRTVVVVGAAVVGVVAVVGVGRDLGGGGIAPAEDADDRRQGDAGHHRSDQPRPHDGLFSKVSLVQTATA